MSGSWCKVASNLDSHPRIRKAGRVGREVFLFALRRNAEPSNPTPGLLAAQMLEDWYLADQLMMSPEEARNGVTAAVTAGLIAQEGAGWRIVGFDDEWGKMPMTGAERVRKFRENKKMRDDVTDETLPKVTGVTGNGCNALDQSRSDQIRVDKNVKKGASPVGSGPAKPDKSLVVALAKVKPAKKPPPDHQPAVDRFDAYYRRTHEQAKPTWNAKTVAMIKALVQKHGAGEVIRRIDVLADTPPDWPIGPWDLPTFVQHFDKCGAPPRRKETAFDVAMKLLSKENQ